MARNRFVLILNGRHFSIRHTRAIFGLLKFLKSTILQFCRLGSLFKYNLTFNFMTANFKYNLTSYNMVVIFKL